MLMTWETWMRSSGGAQGQATHESGNDESSFHTAFLALVRFDEAGIAALCLTDIDGTKPSVSVCRPRVTVCNDCGRPFTRDASQQIMVP